MMSLADLGKARGCFKAKINDLLPKRLHGYSYGKLTEEFYKDANYLYLTTENWDVWLIMNFPLDCEVTLG